MNINLRDGVQSLSSFKRDTTRYMKRLRKTKEPLVLTVNGKAAMVVLDVPEYEKFLEARDFVETVNGIQRGLRDMELGKEKPARTFFKAFFEKHDIEET